MDVCGGKFIFGRFVGKNFRANISKIILNSYVISSILYSCISHYNERRENAYNHDNYQQLNYGKPLVFLPVHLGRNYNISLIC